MEALYGRIAMQQVLEEEVTKLGRSCDDVFPKIQVKVDMFGMSLEIMLTQAQASDIRQARRLLKENPCNYILADKKYDTKYFH